MALPGFTYSAIESAQLTFQSLPRPLRKVVTSFIADLWFWGARLWPYADAAHPKLLRFGCSCPHSHLILFVGVRFSRDPLADICWAILQLDAARFAAPKKTDNVLIHQR